MIDTDKYEELTIDDWYKMNHHDWKDVINEYNDLLAEVKRLREMYEEAIHHLDLMVGAFGIEALTEMLGEEE